MEAVDSTLPRYRPGSDNSHEITALPADASFSFDPFFRRRSSSPFDCDTFQLNWSSGRPPNLDFQLGTCPPARSSPQTQIPNTLSCSWCAEEQANKVRVGQSGGGEGQSQLTSPPGPQAGTLLIPFSPIHQHPLRPCAERVHHRALDGHAERGADQLTGRQRARLASRMSGRAAAQSCMRAASSME